MIIVWGFKRYSGHNWLLLTSHTWIGVMAILSGIRYIFQFEILICKCGLWKLLKQSTNKKYFHNKNNGLDHVFHNIFPYRSNLTLLLLSLVPSQPHVALSKCSEQLKCSKNKHIVWTPNGKVKIYLKRSLLYFFLQNCRNIVSL